MSAVSSGTGFIGRHGPTLQLAAAVVATALRAVNVTAKQREENRPQAGSYKVGEAL
jgi:hypothetical protein